VTVLDVVTTPTAPVMATGMAIAAAIAAIARTATTQATAITVVPLSGSVLVQWGSASALGRSKLIETHLNCRA